MILFGYRIPLALAVTICLAAAPAHGQGGAPAISPGKMEEVLKELRQKRLLFPVCGRTVRGYKDTFSEARGTRRVHNAMDAPAPRGTPVVSTDSGRVIKLFTSRAGGLTVYTTDVAERFIYYYAHLDRYRTGLREGMRLTRGDVLGYVGTTGNAPPNTPHLHFAILKSSDIKRWSKGTPVNPFKVFTRQDLTAGKVVADLRPLCDVEYQKQATNEK